MTAAQACVLVTQDESLIERIIVLDQVKTHVRKHQTVYSMVAIAGITCVIMRGRNASVLRVLDGSFDFPRSSTVTIRPLTFLSHRTTVVAVVSRGTQGPPSWVVRCLETGEIFISQADAAKAMNISASILSSHLNGKFEHALGNHFERICMAA
jgi:hypothetical protein